MLNILTLKVCKGQLLCQCFLLCYLPSTLLNIPPLLCRLCNFLFPLCLVPACFNHPLLLASYLHGKIIHKPSLVIVVFVASCVISPALPDIYFFSSFQVQFNFPFGFALQFYLGLTPLLCVGTWKWWMQWAFKVDTDLNSWDIITITTHPFTSKCKWTLMCYL